MKLGLGTVQFGLPYGIANRQGQPSIEAVREILNQATIAGVHTIDTAPLYGESESILGTLLPHSHSFEIVTKTPQFNHDRIDTQDSAHLRKTFEQSLEKLRQPSVYALLVHRSTDLTIEGGEQLWEQMQDLKASGKVQKIGVSVYSSQDIDTILARCEIDIIQLPLNLFDQRLITNGYLTSLKKLGIKIHVRSAFLQGLLLMSSADRPAFFKPLESHFSHYQNILNTYETTPLIACLDFLNQCPEIDRIICGVDHLSHFKQIITALGKSSGISQDAFSSFAIQDAQFLNPSQWK
jgi:aryl-alcohol dehydrogenase-like predicted oxidoreductase